MSWNLDIKDTHIFASMSTNSMNVMNAEFFADLNQCLDKAESDHPHKPLVLFSAANVFSAGLDLKYVFPIFQSKDEKRVAAWFSEFKNTMFRLLNSPRKTIAAINGHCFAGGVVLSLCCDFRLGADDESLFSLNETPMGIPIPASYAELFQYKLGRALAYRMTLSGESLSMKEAFRVGAIHELAVPSELNRLAQKHADLTGSSCWPTYAYTKKTLLEPLNQTLNSKETKELDEDCLKVLISDESLSAQREAAQKLRRS